MQHTITGSRQGKDDGPGLQKTMNEEYLERKGRNVPLGTLQVLPKDIQNMMEPIPWFMADMCRGWREEAVDNKLF